MPQLTADLFHHILEKDLAQLSQKRFLVAASGGPDSMVLASLCHEIGLSFSLAHVNYHLRGEDSIQDAQLVADFAQKHQLEIFQKEISPEERKSAGNIQVWARQIRYDFFRKIREEEKFDFVMTAHHLNDNLETFFINLSRASGLKGLTGIPRLTDRLYRPLLGFSRKEILKYAQENKVKFRMDLSNEKDDYLRNRIRHHLTPVLAETSPGFLENFSESLRYLTQTQNFLDQIVSEKKKQLIHQEEGLERIPLRDFLKEMPFLQFEILRSYGFENETENVKILSARSGAVFQAKAWEVLKKEEYLIFRQKTAEKAELAVLPVVATAVYQLQDHLPQLPLYHREWQLSGSVSLPLILRKPQEGDVFQPQGMKGSKKVGKFLRDEKISPFERENIWVLTDGDQKILGVVPLRQDGRFAQENGRIKIRF